MKNVKNKKKRRLWEENFEQPYLVQDRRYQALTDRCGYRIVRGVCKSEFWVIFKTLLDWCSFGYITCVLELDAFFLSQDMIAQKFLPIVINKNLHHLYFVMPQIMIGDKAHYETAIAQS